MRLTLQSDGIAANSNLFDVLIVGPPDSAYSGGVFKLQVAARADYPMSAPNVKFITPIFYPKISIDGFICLDILGSQWSPAYSFEKLLTSVILLLSAPSVEHGPNNEEAAHRFESDPSAFHKKARDHTLLVPVCPQKVYGSGRF